MAEITYRLNCRDCGRPITTVSETDLDMDMQVKVAGKWGSYDLRTVKPFVPLKNMIVCNPCADKRISARAEGVAKSRKQLWDQLCPKAYQKTEPHRLPSPTKLERILRWKFGGERGLLLAGPSGRGKTRCAWKLLQREFFAGRSVSCIDSTFGLRYMQKVATSGAVAFEWLDHQMRVDILFMDDTLKVKLDNSGSETALFAVIEERMANQKPIILTTNDTVESLAQRMSSDRAEATIRRLRECCEIIPFE